MKVLVAAAGSGGHINPGIAIANKIKEEQPDAEIIFVGTKRGLENDLVPRSGFELEKIEVYGVSREISYTNFKKMCKTLKGFFQARKLVKRIKPDIVIGTGGYICGPIFLAANKYKIPTLLHESNAFPGVTVKMLSKKVKTILVAFKDAKERLPKGKNVILTGTPTKIKDLKLSQDEIDDLKKNQGFVTNKPLVLVYGGSQGAKSINESIIEIIELSKNKEYEIMWATGPKQYEIIRKELEDKKIDINNINGVKILPYIYNMDEAMNISDLCVCRSGAMTITEMSIIGKPAIFAPFPFAAENHQEYNAKVLVNQGAARILTDKNMTGNTLNDLINEMIKDRNKLKQMGENAKKIVINNVEDKIYDEIRKLMNLKK